MSRNILLDSSYSQITPTSVSLSITNAIPVVFRHIKHLETCINYILEQTLLPNEIIIIISEYIDNEDNKKNYR